MAAHGAGQDLDVLTELGAEVLLPLKSRDVPLILLHPSA